ncbi:hypothetical protein RRSWK_00083 [Rhodopirellula sp. SWK7]|nr:hypothetical protein RRSWK_00083 [Rhodopirellula sp. SWK7]
MSHSMVSQEQLKALRLDWGTIRFSTKQMEVSREYCKPIWKIFGRTPNQPFAAACVSPANFESDARHP